MSHLLERIDRAAKATSSRDGMKEMFWPPNGFLFKEIALAPVICKPKLIPLKSITLEKLERMQAEALEKLKQMEEEQKRLAEEEAQTTAGGQEAAEGAAAPKQADIWQAGESTPRND
ncbi:hypothetical protein M3Y99_01104900 [Aphelenchoides fujianensis]|nr:hypothetical protein M3Y99_01104900 [Aphelenchoides fujianensis]